MKQILRDIWDALKGNEHDYTRIKLRKAILLLAIPMVLEMLMESVFALFDIFFVSRLGDEAVAVVGLTESRITSYNVCYTKLLRTAFVAPNAVVCGEVTVGKHVRIMFGAQIIAESSPITLGDYCIVLENAVIRGTGNFPVYIGNNCLIGPNAHLVGCRLEENVFVATGASIFHGALLRKGSEVSINGVVHLT